MINTSGKLGSQVLNLRLVCFNVWDECLPKLPKTRAFLSPSSLDRKAEQIKKDNGVYIINIHANRHGG